MNRSRPVKRQFMSLVAEKDIVRVIIQNRRSHSLQAPRECHLAINTSD